MFTVIYSSPHTLKEQLANKLAYCVTRCYRSFFKIKEYYIKSKISCYTHAISFKTWWIYNCTWQGYKEQRQREIWLEAARYKILQKPYKYEHIKIPEYLR